MFTLWHLCTRPADPLSHRPGRRRVTISDHPYWIYLYTFPCLIELRETLYLFLFESCCHLWYVCLTRNLTGPEATSQYGIIHTGSTYTLLLTFLLRNSCLFLSESWFCFLLSFMISPVDLLSHRPDLRSCHNMGSSIPDLPIHFYSCSHWVKRNLYSLLFESCCHLWYVWLTRHLTDWTRGRVTIGDHTYWIYLYTLPCLIELNLCLFLSESWFCLVYNLWQVQLTSLLTGRTRGIVMIKE